MQEGPLHCGSQSLSATDTICLPSNVRFTPQSRHARVASRCPLCAKTGLMQCSKRTCMTPANVFAPQPPRGKRDKKQRNKVSRCNKRPANPEAEVVDPLAGAARVARRRAENVWREVPRTAPVHMVVAVAAFDPGGTIRRRVIIIVVDAILDPLIDVADHVIEAERIGLE